MERQQATNSSQAPAGNMKPPARRSSIASLLMEEMGPSFDPRKSLEFTGPFMPPSSAGGRGNQTEKLPRIAETKLPVTSSNISGGKGKGTTNHGANANPTRSVPNSKLKGPKSHSKIPTPLGKTPMASSRTISSKTVVRPAPATSSLARSRHVSASSSNLQPPQRNKNVQAFSVKQTITVSSNNRGASSTVSKPKGLQRTSSMDSFAWLMMNSTCATPGSSRRFSGFGGSTTVKKKLTFCTKSAEKLYRSSSNQPVQKTLKMPDSSDRQQLNQAALTILDILADFNYPKRMSVAELKGAPVKEYFNIVQYFLEIIGMKRFTGTKVPDEFVPQLLDVIATLKYPGTITKSVLRSSNTPHSWPAALTFLVWLGCRVSSICTPRSFGSKSKDNVNALSGDVPPKHFTEIALESYRRMFFKVEKGTDNNFEGEKEDYRKNIMDEYMFEQNETVVSLEEALVKQQQDFATLEAFVDPSTEVVANSKLCLVKKTEILSKQGELKNLLVKYKNIEHLNSQTGTLAKKIVKEEEHCAEISARVSQQPMSILELQTIEREIEETKKQQHSLVQVIDTMKNKLRIRNQTINNSGNIFYHLCEKFRIVDDFNEHLSSFEKLGLLSNMEKAKRNPFNQLEFDLWLKDLRRIVRHTIRILSELKLNLRHDWKHEGNMRMVAITDDIERYERESSNTEMEIAKLREDSLGERSQMKLLIGGRFQEQTEALKIIGKFDSDLKLQKVELNKLEDILKTETERNLKLTEEVDKSDSRVEQTYLEGRHAKMKMYEKHCVSFRCFRIGKAFNEVQQIIKEKREQFHAERNKILGLNNQA